MDRVGDSLEGGQVRDQRRRAVDRADAPVSFPRPDRAGTRRLGDRHRAGPRPPAAAIAVPARKGKRAGRPVHPREISFTAARRAVITTTRAGTATASLPASAITANRDSALASLARRRVGIDRNRHRDRTTKARLSFPPGGPRVPALTARAQISVCVPIAA